MKIIALFLFLLIGSVNVASAKVYAFLSNTKVKEGTAVTLTFKSYDKHLYSLPDLAGLDENFEIEGKNSKTNMEYKNGKMRTLSELSVSLLPKKSGKITIGAFKIEGEETAPLSLEVVPASSGYNENQPVQTKARRIFLKGEMTQKTGYVGQGLLYRLKLIYDEENLKGEILPPQGKNIEVRQVGEDTSGVQEIDGKPYDYIERDFLIFPKKAGDFKAKGASFRGTIPEAFTKKQEDIFAPFGMSPDVLYQGKMGEKQLFLKEKEIAFHVYPIPASFDASSWLPAKKVLFTETYSPKEIDSFKVGDSFSRDIVLEAVGTLPSFLPELSFPQIEGFRIYPGEVKTKTHLLKGELVSKKMQSFVFVPIKKGTLTLPALSLNWFNVETGKKEQALLPSKTIKIKSLKENEVNTFEKTDANTPLKTSKITDEKRKALESTAFVKEEHINTASNPKEEQISLKTALLLMIGGMVFGGLFIGFGVFLFLKKSKKKTKTPLNPLYPY